MIVFVSFLLIITMSYFALILSFYLGLVSSATHQKRAKPVNAAVPISVVVAFRNEQENLAVLLSALDSQTYRRDKWEVILVNDHSTDLGPALIERCAANGGNLRLINLPEGRTGKKAALALGIAHASYSWIALTDADCRPAPRWLETIAEHASDNTILIQGPVSLWPTKTITQKLDALEHSSLMASTAGSFGVGMPIMASSANLAFRNDILGVSDETLNPDVPSGDDMFLLHHAKAFGLNRQVFMLDGRAMVTTASPGTLRQVLNQRKRWASKAPAYTDADTIIAGATVLLFNLMLLVAAVATFINGFYGYVFLGMAGAKLLVDFLLLNRYLSFSSQRNLLNVFIPLQLVYPIYIVFTALSGVISSGKWKGRRIKQSIR
jgi:cellulose synthase/poly-beta-1,6-N-acetylglucosamine synthase-like glycosyltransferase